MTADKQSIIDKYNLTVEKLAKIAGVAEKTAQKWIDGELPESVFRLIQVTYNEVPPDTYKA